MISAQTKYLITCDCCHSTMAEGIESPESVMEIALSRGAWVYHQRHGTKLLACHKCNNTGELLAQRERMESSK